VQFLAPVLQRVWVEHIHAAMVQRFENLMTGLVRSMPGFSHVGPLLHNRQVDQYCASLCPC